MIINLVKPFGSMLKLKDINIYDNVFKMHTKLTVVILLVFSMLVSAHEFFGVPINCLLGDNAFQAFAEHNCWVNGTFTERYVSKVVNGRVISEKVAEYQKYYQWIIIVLILQATVCYMPAYLWKGWERGRMKQLCSTLASPILSADYENEKNIIIRYLSTDHSRIHAVYVLRYVICEVMNFLIVVLNMWFLNVIFNQFWTRYLPAITALFTTGGGAFSILASELFPKLAKCTYTDTGPSGTTQIKDAYCILSLNILNEKIFAFLYIWFLILLIVSGCNLIKRSIILVSSTLRLKLLRSLAISEVPLSNKQWKYILTRDNIGDWFILFQLGRNLNPIVFCEILDEIANGKKLNNEN